ncbi:substrate-binding domain-containing protein [Actinomadura monticuli]|uniref:Substrate-binding domain-containing protein n=1 Tax=Actinomadura monticuli TaxID=3097367 RepID=A0ABV4Q9H8_9ACTN
MSGYDDVPEWAPRTPPESGEFGIPYTFPGDPGATGATGAPGAPGADGGPSAPPGGAADGGFDYFAKPDRSSRPPGPAHAAAKRTRKRPRPSKRTGGIMLGPLAGAVVLVMLTGFAAYAFTSAADTCSGDDALTIDVATSPEISPAVVRAAKRFNDARNEVAGMCARASVRSADPAAVATLLSGKGVSGVTEQPDVWIPDSSLWSKLAEGSGRAGATAAVTELGGMASTPIVLAMPGSLATQLRNLGAPAQPSWKDLITAAGTAENAERGSGPAAEKSPIPSRLFRLQVPDPGKTATGMGTLMLANALLSDDPQGQAMFAGAVRTFREGVAASVTAQFAAFGEGTGDRYPIALTPEQAVFAHNAKRPTEIAAAVYPAEGTLYLDHPVSVLSGDAAKLSAGRLLFKELTSDATGEDVRRLGFRTPDGTAPAAFSERTGLSEAAPKGLTPPSAAEVEQIMQQWAKLSLSLRMLSIIDISGSMSEKIAPGLTRLQATIRTAQNGLSLLPDDSEAGEWVFSTHLKGEQDWREVVSVGPLGERLGSVTRRQALLSTFTRTTVKKNGDTGLYETVIAAFDDMKRTYKAEYINSVVLWTDGKNDDEDGPSLAETLKHIRDASDPQRPILIYMLGLGDGVDVGELRQIAKLTNGDALVAQTPGQIQSLFLKSLSDQACGSNC